MKVLIVSDIHANWPALSVVVTTESYDRLICLGDVVDYGPHPQPCLAYVRQYAALGYGWMQQVIEAEWQSHVLSRGEPDASWGPAYFTQELARLEQQGKEESRHE